MPYLRPSSTKSRQNERAQVAHQRQQNTKLPVLYQKQKGKAHGYFVNTQTQLSYQTH